MPSSACLSARISAGIGVAFLSLVKANQETSSPSSRNIRILRWNRASCESSVMISRRFGGGGLEFIGINRRFKPSAALRHQDVLAFESQTAGVQVPEIILTRLVRSALPRSLFTFNKHLAPTCPTTLV